MRGMMVAVLTVAMLGGGVDRVEAARRRPIRCCIMVPADDGERPYCFVLNVRPARSARRICRAIGGTPARAPVR